MSFPCREDWYAVLQSFKHLEWARGWPLLPVAGGTVLQLTDLQTSVAIRQSSEWSRSLPTALMSLGCRHAFLLPGLGSPDYQLGAVLCRCSHAAEVLTCSNMCTCPLQLACRPVHCARCRLVEESSTYSHPQLLKHIHVGSGVGILKALTNVHASGGQWNAASVTPKQRRDLRDYLLHVSMLVECAMPIPQAEAQECNVPSGRRQGCVCLA